MTCVTSSSVGSRLFCMACRATFDLDILIDATPDNARKLLDAFLDAQLGTAALISPEELLANEITIFKDRVRFNCRHRPPYWNSIRAGSTAKSWNSSSKHSMSFHGMT